MWEPSTAIPQLLLGVGRKNGSWLVPSRFARPIAPSPPDREALGPVDEGACPGGHREGEREQQPENQEGSAHQWSPRCHGPDCSPWSAPPGTRLLAPWARPIRTGRSSSRSEEHTS